MRIANGSGQGATVDIGAFEVQDYVVNVTTDPAATSNYQLSLRQAIVQANTYPTNSVRISFSSGVSGTITLANPLGTLEIDSNVDLTGPGEQSDGQGEQPLDRLQRLHRRSRHTVFLSGLTVTGGNAAASGGGINNNGTLALNSVVLSNNAAATSGGGINNTGALIVVNTTIAGNRPGPAAASRTREC